MKISVKYNTPENGVLEIGFYRNETLLHNVFYDIEGLDEDEIFELKKEAIAKFGVVFPEISNKDIMKGFAGVDKKIEKLYFETFEKNEDIKMNKRGRKELPEEEKGKNRTIKMNDWEYEQFRKNGSAATLKNMIRLKLFNTNLIDEKLWNMAREIVSSPAWDGKIKTAESLIRSYNLDEIADMYDLMRAAERGKDWE